MVSAEHVEATLRALGDRVARLDPSYRTLLPARRRLEAQIPDLEVAYHALWHGGNLSDLRPGPDPRADIRLWCDSDVLVALANGELHFRTAYATSQVRLEASVTDLLRLRGILVSGRPTALNPTGD